MADLGNEYSYWLQATHAFRDVDHSEGLRRRDDLETAELRRSTLELARIKLSRAQEVDDERRDSPKRCDTLRTIILAATRSFKALAAGTCLIHQISPDSRDRWHVLSPARTNNAKFDSFEARA